MDTYASSPMIPTSQIWSMYSSSLIRNSFGCSCSACRSPARAVGVNVRCDVGEVAAAVGRGAAFDARVGRERSSRARPARRSAPTPTISTRPTRQPGAAPGAGCRRRHTATIATGTSSAVLRSWRSPPRHISTKAIAFSQQRRRERGVNIAHERERHHHQPSSWWPRGREGRSDHRDAAVTAEFRVDVGRRSRDFRDRIEYRVRSIRRRSCSPCGARSACRSR